MLKIMAISIALPLAGMSVAYGQDMSKMMPMKQGMTMSEADKAYMQAMQAMHDTMMKTEMTGDASGDFARMMIPHHQSAIEMANALLMQADADPDLKRMAEKIKTDQAKEIAEMKAWLQAHPQR
jgi:uncharacterized protein (DUF305 family)